MPVAVGTSALSSLVTPEGLENAAREVDRQLQADRQYPELAEQINASQGKLALFPGAVLLLYFTITGDSSLTRTFKGNRKKFELSGARRK